MLKIALTGNIASGKSAVLEYFKTDAVSVFCLDEATEKLYQDDNIKQILEHEFNTSLKSEISKIVFSDSKKLKRLEEIFYPEIKRVLFKYFEDNSDKKYVVVAAPMLFESGFSKYFDKIIFVSADEKIRLLRLVKRNSLTENEAIIRISAQEAEENKIKKSDFIIYNNSDFDALRAQYLNIKKELDIL